MKKIILLYFFLTLIVSTIQAQDVPELNYNQFKPWLEKQTDTVYVVNFWATWCKPCVEELPHFLQIAQELKEEKVKFVFVSLDFPKHKETRLLPYIEKEHIEEQVILLNDPNSNEWIDKVNPEWSGAIPATIVYKKNDLSFIEGSMSYEELTKTINSKLP